MRASVLALCLLVTLTSVGQSIRYYPVAAARRRADDASRRIVRVRRAIADHHQALLQLPEYESDRRDMRILRKKKRRLKELREEIRTLNEQIDGNGTTHRTGRRLKTTTTTSRQDKWRKKVLAKMRLIVKRLDRLERKWMRDRVKPEAALSVATTIASIPLQTTEMPVVNSAHPPHTRKQNKHLLSIVRSLNGENGTACASHKDCRPGRCCHRSSSGPAVCVFHSLSESAFCMDSCQCTHQLHCFQTHNNATRALCKKAESTDILKGFYLNEKESYFPRRK